MKRPRTRNISVLIVETLVLALLVPACGDGGADGTGGGQRPPIFAPLVFVADEDVDGVDELYAAFNDGSDIVKLSNQLVAGGDVVAFLVSPDGFFVAYVADQATNGVFELYVVPVDRTSGETAVKVSRTMAGSGIRQLPSGDYLFAWAPNSSRVAYIADQNSAGVFELFTSTPNGADNDRLSGGLVANGDALDFRWQPGSTLLAYAADQDSDNVVELYVAPADGSLIDVKVSGAMAGAGLKELPAPASGGYAFEWAPDSSRIAYLADQGAINEFELFTSTPDGTVNLNLSNLLTGNERDVEAFAWAPDSQKIAYTANQNLINAIDLYTVAPDGSGSPLQISSGIFAGQRVTTFKWAPDSARVAFISDKGSTGFFRLFSTSPNNNNNIFISGSLAGTFEVSAFEWAPNAAVIAYAVKVPGNLFQLFTTFPDTEGSQQISVDLVDGQAESFRWAPDSARIAYIADQNSLGVFELFASAPDGSVIEVVSGPPVPGGDVFEFKWAPDASALGYLADQDFDGILELFASLPDGAENTKLSGSLVIGGAVFSFEWVP